MADFFAGLDAPKETSKLLWGMILLSFLVLVGIFINFPSQEKNASIFLYLLFFVTIAAAFRTSGVQTRFFSFNGLGSNRQMVSAGLLGLASAFLLVKTPALQSFIPPQLSLSEGQNIFTTSYVLFGAPVVEELFFSGFLIASLLVLLDGRTSNLFGMRLGGNVLAIGLVVAAFGLYHLYGAYQGDISKVFGSMVFRLLAILGLYATRSLSYPMTFHFATNLLLYYE